DSIYQPAEDSYLLDKVLKKEIPKLLKDNPNLGFLEIGAGSGILLETAKELGIKPKNIFATDINQTAVKHCQDQGFNCILSDLFEEVEGQYNIIIFNPPYLPEDSQGLEPEESQLATTGGALGSELINKFLEQAKEYLEEGEDNGRIFILTSSLTKGIDWKNYKKKLIGKENLFMEDLFVWELSL
ncbi:methyltransferase, partial [Candidatus Pacearchaeota archaeon]|nr:methyltransferase [Candidatus Pacearchaeota archaeon]